MPEDQEPITPVVFRRFGRGKRCEITAFFPAEEFADGLCTCYAHIGQHGGANYASCIARSRPAKPAEYADLKRELESAPYNYRFKVYQRWSGR